jgi:hypothetical protein
MFSKIKGKIAQLGKEKLMRCGIIIEDMNRNILILKEVNDNFYKIPSEVLIIDDMSYWRTAKRAALEKTGIHLNDLHIHDLEVLGYFPYTEEEDLFLFRLITHTIPNTKELYCKDMEVSDYEVIKYKEYPRWLSKDLVTVLDKIYKDKNNEFI